ncbi:MAG: magnesium transporter [Deltaproteobacteria bacterium]|nr:magnesium transporter [Deltaproteobacteria bacterium]
MQSWKQEIVRLLQQLLNDGLEAEAAEMLAEMHPVDVARVIERLDAEEKRRVFHILDAKTASEVVVELSDTSREDILEDMESERLAVLVDDLPSDEATDIIAELPTEQAAEVLSRIDLQDTVEVNALLKYPEDSAGGIMQLELVAAKSGQSVRDVVEAMRRKQEEVGELYNVYVVGPGNILLGTLPLHKIITAEPGAKLDTLMEPCQVTFRADEDQEEVVNRFRRYDVVSAPVVDEHGRLLGRITIDDVMEVMEEEIREDLLQMAGGSAEEEMFYSNRILRISRLRLPWLLTNLLGGLVTGSLLWMFKVTLTDAIFLVTFVPVITAMGGNVGIQSSTIMVRGFAVGAISYQNLLATLLKEFRVALVMGLVCGVVVGLVAMMWHHNPVLGLVVGIAMMGAITAASVVGTLAPAIFKRLGVDPAIASGPFVTTANDITGILIYFSVATLFYTALMR